MGKALDKSMDAGLYAMAGLQPVTDDMPTRDAFESPEEYLQALKEYNAQ